MQSSLNSAGSLLRSDAVQRVLALGAEQRYQLTMRVADGSLGMSALTDLVRDVIA